MRKCGRRAQFSFSGPYGGNPVRLAVYTAIFRDYDDLKEPAAQDIGCDFLCFTDAPRVYESAWRTVSVKLDASLHPRMQAKRYKLLSHEVFPGGRLAFRYAPLAALSFSRPRYDATIWVDASLSIRSSAFARDSFQSIAKPSWARFTDPDRACIFEEAIASAAMLKYRGLPIEGQVESYRRCGIQPHSGLYACGVIARKEPLPAKLIHANQIWWAENLRWTYQD